MVRGYSSGTSSFTLRALGLQKTTRCRDLLHVEDASDLCVIECRCEASHGLDRIVATLAAVLAVVLVHRRSSMGPTVPVDDDVEWPRLGSVSDDDLVDRCRVRWMYLQEARGVVWVINITGSR
jgi:hypothetical protein